MSDIDRASQAGVPLVKGGFADLWTENQRLKLELSAAQKDAERYRWILDRMEHQRHGPAIGWTLDMLLPGDDPVSAIDAAIAAEKPPPPASAPID